MRVSVLVALSLLAAAGGCQRKPEKPTPRYNVLLITLDTVRADRLGAYGYAKARTPALDALAASGVRFEDAISPVPLTLPAHASIFTGSTPLRHAVHLNGQRTLPSTQRTLAQSFAEAKYRTGAFVGAFVLDRRFGLDRGFEHYDDEIDRENGTSGSELEAERPASVVVDRALRWLASLRADEPFFGWVHLYDAHAPYRPPAGFDGGDPYDGELAYLDSQLARLFEFLQQRGLRERTIVVVTADHGESLGEHAESTHGLLLYRSTLRVPLIVAGPGSGRRGATVTQPVSLIDVAASIAELAGVAAPLAAEGRSLGDLIRGEDGGKLVSAIYSETEYPRMLGWSPLTSLQEGSLRLVRGTFDELFDVGNDPQELSEIGSGRRRDAHRLGGTLQAIVRQKVVVAAVAVDAETKAKLASLGYLGNASVPGTGGADPRKMASLFSEHEKAMTKVSEGRLIPAGEILERLVVADPKNPLFRSALASIRRRQSRFVDAVTLQREALLLNPEDADSWFNLGLALQEEGNSEEAQKVLTEASRRDPGRAEVLNVLGLSLMQNRKPLEALSAFKRAVDLDPENARAWNNQGNLLRELGRQEDAEVAYQRAIHESPKFSDPLNGLGAIAVEQGRTTEAIALFNRALIFAPSNHELRLNRAIALHTAGNIEAAAAGYREFLAVTAKLPSFREQRESARKLLASTSASMGR